jgi:hypothetical protein
MGFETNLQLPTSANVATHFEISPDLSEILAVQNLCQFHADLQFANIEHVSSFPRVNLAIKKSIKLKIDKRFFLYHHFDFCLLKASDFRPSSWQ